MKANEFVKKYGIEAAKDLWCGAFDLYNNNLQILNGMVCSISGNQFLFELIDIKRLVESHELIEKLGGLDVCKKIMFQKRLRQPKATHVLQHHENKKLIQFFSTNQSKPNGSVMLDAIEQAIADVESCQ